MKDFYKKQIQQEADAIAKALASGEDISITTTKSGQLKIKALKITIIKSQEATQAGK